jgi:hypothetical protein
MGRIFIDAVYQVIGNHRTSVCCFIRAKGTQRNKSGPYQGRLKRDNFVVHDSEAIQRRCSKEILLTLTLADHGVVYVQTRVSFVNALLEVWNGY